MTTKIPSDEVATAYDVWAEVYDTQVNVTRDLDARILREQDSSLFQGDVLEVGCGTGKNTEWIASRARSLLALDASEMMLKRARERAGVERVRFVHHDLRKPWPARDSSHDTVTCNLVLEHIEDLSFVFSEARRVLRPGGSFFVCELHPFRQLQGRQAYFMNPETGTVQHIRSYLHDVSDYLSAALGSSFVLVRAQEWRDDGEPKTAVPRLLSMRWLRP